MSDKTHISWSDSTWPVARGCDKISPGCKFCWAIKDANRMQHNPNPKAAEHFEGLTVIEGGKPNWSGVVRLDESILSWPLKWKKARNIFVASSGDLFHEALPDEAIDRVFVIMLLCPQHRFQVLTKRPERMLKYWRDAAALRDRWFHVLHDTRIFPGDPRRAVLGRPSRAGVAEGITKGWRSLLLPNVQMGFSAENQHWFDIRWAAMREIAKMGWLVWCSYEPALGPIDMSKALSEGLRWVVCGGESGPGARPMHADWAKGVRDQCVAAGVSFHFKQWGHWQDGSSENPGVDCVVLNDGRRFSFTVEPDYETRGRWNDFAPRMMAPVGKKAAGRLLDGRLWDEFPEVRALDVPE